MVEGHSLKAVGYELLSKYDFLNKFKARAIGKGESERSGGEASVE